MSNHVSLSPRLDSSGTTIFTVMSKLASEHKAINLGQGFPDFECDEKLKELVAKHLKEGKNQYVPLAGLPKLNETLSKKMEHLYGMPINPDSQICVTAGATQALYTAIMAFVKEGDEVIIFEPAYDCYTPQIKIAGGIVKPYIMTYPDYGIDWNKVKEMVTDKTRMIIINTPHNPSGTVLNESDMKSLENIISGTNIVVLSDEVYEHLIFDGENHQSVMQYSALFEQSLAVFSFGKTLHATGWKLGYIVGPEYLIKEFKVIHQWNVFCTNSFVQFAIAEYLAEPKNYEYLPSFFEEKRNIMNELLTGVPLTPKVAKGTYFQAYDYSEVSDMDDLEFAKYLTSKIGVAAIPMSPFYTNPPGDKVIRLCFAKKEETIEAAAERLMKLRG
ncbi:2-keto-4-methylthiobutyrate aminotransferase apoenzyme [Ekhidna lutea]|uniref:2-keto-4-methylthiobutyrate aminotransferase apoenzyme n=1 Tax=Ekhidna lutea TaxID=447679 RepID=A0A239HZI4_EKHLU|nr:methionine aminotransferase [Ekhidna lutea]SNS86705.1 2-keto-4-methylthiobutyrate aminotransferase apoenzyme [Ekhidna lutea]